MEAGTSAAPRTDQYPTDEGAKEVQALLSDLPGSPSFLSGSVPVPHEASLLHLCTQRPPGAGYLSPSSLTRTPALFSALLLPFKDSLVAVCSPMPVCLSVTHVSGGQERALDPLELQL